MSCMVRIEMDVTAVAAVGDVTVLVNGKSVKTAAQSDDGSSQRYWAVQQCLSELNRSQRFSCTVSSEYGRCSG